MSAENWTCVAMSDDSLVADALLQLRHSKPPPSPVKLKWSVRQRRSRKGDHTRASPTSPLTWSGATSFTGCWGGATTVEGLEESSVAVKPYETFRSKAFASQFVYCRNKLGLDSEKINVNGGAIAIGHPLGATGARCVATLLHEMKRRGKDCRFGVVSMCIGSGMGAAGVFERGDVVDEFTNVRTVE